MSRAWLTVNPVRIVATVAILLAVGGLGWIVGALYPSLATQAVVADEEAWPPVISVQRLLEGEREVGELLVNGQSAIQFRAYTPGQTPYERVSVVAERLRHNLRPQEQMTISTSLQNGDSVVLVNEVVLLTVVPADLPENMQPKEAAQIWAEVLAARLGVVFVMPQEAVAWTADEPYDDKIVPIISLGKGKRLGAARVNGPASAVKQVQAVAQLESTMLKWFHVQMYVPISTKVPGEKLARVQGVAVTAVGDLRL